MTLPRTSYLSVLHVIGPFTDKEKHLAKGCGGSCRRTLTFLAVLFAAAMFCAPVVTAIPSYATAKEGKPRLEEYWAWPFVFKLAVRECQYCRSCCGHEAEWSPRGVRAILEMDQEAPDIGHDAKTTRDSSIPSIIIPSVKTRWCVVATRRSNDCLPELESRS
jgi:hypothetical protein